MAKKLYLSPTIRVRSLDVEQLLDGGSITNINDGGSGDDRGRRTSLRTGISERLGLMQLKNT